MAKILIASTSLHLIDSLIIKHQFKDEYHIVFIGGNSDFFELIKNDFKSFLHLEEKKDKNKIRRRIKNSKKLLDYVKCVLPDEIIMGNDRKIENAVLIKNFDTVYSYMDDGLHSYLPEKQHILKYTWFEKKLKEIIYKNRLVLPKYIGGGEYIKNAYLFRPDLANEYLKDKTLFKLIPDTEYLNSYFKSFVNVYWQKKFNEAEQILFMPHPKFINKDILNKINKFINNNTLVKLHPRDNITKIDATLVPNEIFSEAVFGFLNKNCKIYGYKTTVLLSAKWLREELNVYDLSCDKNYEKFGVMCEKY